jgi:hypothetical protein
MFAKYCKANDRAMLKRMYRSFGRRLEAGLFEVSEAYRSHDMTGRLQLLREASTLFKAGTSTDKQMGFYQKVVEEQIALSKMQLDLVQSTSLVRVSTVVAVRCFHVVCRNRWIWWTCLCTIPHSCCTEAGRIKLRTI